MPRSTRENALAEPVTIRDSERAGCVKDARPSYISREWLQFLVEEGSKDKGLKGTKRQETKGSFHIPVLNNCDPVRVPISWVVGMEACCANGFRFDPRNRIRGRGCVSARKPGGSLTYSHTLIHILTSSPSWQVPGMLRLAIQQHFATRWHAVVKVVCSENVANAGTAR